MRNISFMLTPDQIRARAKTVTRRTGWKNLKPGTLLCAVRKGMGLKKGEKVERLATIRVVEVRRERLDRMILEPEYGRVECDREGFPEMDPANFTKFFRRTHAAIKDAGMEVTRIEFEYVEDSHG